MVNVAKLKGKIVERDITQEELAKNIGITKSTFYRKMKQNGNFSIKEVNLIVSSLNLTKDEAINIFLLRQSHKCDKLKWGFK
ncbi:phage repressor [Streptococcus gordonii]|uniref:helix-turn-helix domain-containing protein n=1 Tax=Streptococcus gordonii TaxID=1302 RepID=UPI0010D6C4E1|nr:helix-turn-helix transcriptional regulator [Streptococcus gordonii]VTT10992.1 phage repressor [Streptococcus gordonii]